MMNDEAAKELYKQMTAPGSFYDLNGGRFKGMPHMTKDQEMEYVSKLVKEPRPVHAWFGLSRSNYFVVPRLALEAMPQDWQQRFVDLFEEASESGMLTPEYIVLRNGSDYTVQRHSDPEDPESRVDEYLAPRDDPWADYRHGDINELKSELKKELGLE